MRSMLNTIRTLSIRERLGRKSTIMMRLLPCTPASLASPDESPNAHNSFHQRDKIQVAGFRNTWKVQPPLLCPMLFVSYWYELASFPGPRPASCRLQYHTASDGKLGEGLETRLGMNAHHLIFKRKYKTNPTKNSSKWWFVIRSDEALLKDLEEKWHLIALQTKWKIEPVLRFSDDSNATSLNHEDPPTEFEAGTSSNTHTPPTSDAFLGNK